MSRPRGCGGLWVLALGCLSLPCAARAEVTPLAKAHAHNDYRHPRPLQDALDQGFCSVEADVHLVDRKLLVGHDRNELQPDRTLESLYLNPLRERIRKHGGHVYAQEMPFRLLVDIKSDAAPTYLALDRVLSEYGEMLTHVTKGRVRAGPVLVVISGNRDQETITNDATRYAGIDGRLSDLGGEAPAHLMPWISDNWSTRFAWDGTGPMPERERAELLRIVQQAHDEQRTLRFWATPETPAAWKTLDDAGVDLINTDDLPGLRAFLTSKVTQPSD